VRSSCWRCVGTCATAYRDVEELLAERGTKVDPVTIYRWVQRFTPLMIDAARPCRHAPRDRWFVDDIYVKVAGRWVYLYRAIDHSGEVIDVLISEKRDRAATRQFFTRALRHGTHPTEVTTDRAPAYLRVLDELLPAACHVREKYANNPSRPPEVPAATDARPHTTPVSASDQHRARVHPEYPPRPRRTRSRKTHDAAGGDGLHRAGPGDLTNRDQRSCLPSFVQRSPPPPGGPGGADGIRANSCRPASRAQRLPHRACGRRECYHQRNSRRALPFRLNNLLATLRVEVNPPVKPCPWRNAPSGSQRGTLTSAELTGLLAQCSRTCPQPQTGLLALVSSVRETSPGTGRAANRHLSPAS
jgi:transposase-like protein